MKKIFLILTMILCLSLIGCEQLMKGTWRISVENNSDIDVYFVVGLDLINGRYVPTTELPDSKEWAFLVKPGVRLPIDYPDGVRGLGDTFIGIFIISSEVMDGHTWDEIREGEMYLKKYEYPCDELPSSPWPIVYP
jgi:hypothetical protein